MNKSYGNMKKGWGMLLVFALAVSSFSGTVPALAAKKPVLSKTKLVLEVKKTAKLKVKGVSSRKIKKITYTSTKKKIATVSKKGKITALKKGTAKIKVKVVLKNKKKYNLVCKVTVKEKAAPSASSAAASVVPSVSPSASATASPSAVVSASPSVIPSPAVSANPSVEPAPTGEIHLSANGISTKDSGVMRENMTAFTLVQDMGLGINLGNTLESCGTWINSGSVSNYETAWGAPVTTQKMITGMKNAGFHALRIPVSWSNMISSDGNYTISDEYFDRVETVMNYAINEGMYVIVNIHYDSGWWARFGSKDQAEREEAMKRYQLMWTQIANRYKEYSDLLIFESANEELGETLNSTEKYAGSGYFSGADAIYDKVNEINQTFVDIVRGTGGNNSKRFLLIAGYDTDIEKTCDSRYKMPSDTIKDHLTVSIHYYTPATYCIAEDPNNSWGYRASWGTSSDISELKKYLGMMKTKFVDQGIPVIIGEYGVGDTVTSGGNERKEGRELFVKNVCEFALASSMCPVLWDISGHFYDRIDCEIINDAERKIFLELAGKEVTEKPDTPVNTTTYVWSGSIGCSGWNPTDITEDTAASDCTLEMLGGCYMLSGVDWSRFTKPEIVFHNVSLSGGTSASCQVSTVVNDSNPYWICIEEDAEKTYKADWAFAKDFSMSLSSLELSGTQSLYLCVRGGIDFSGKVTITIREKQ